MRREIPLLIAFTTGIIMILAFFSPLKQITSAGEVLPIWNSIINAFAVFLALTSLVSVHGNRISRHEPGSEYSIVLLITLFVTLGLGFYFGPEEYFRRPVYFEAEDSRERILQYAKTFEEKATRAEKVEYLEEISDSAGAVLGVSRIESLNRNLRDIASEGIEKAKDGPDAGKYVHRTAYYNPFHWIYLYVYNPLQATMFSILAFFVASAAYRAFRARTLEGTLLLVAAFLVMIGRVSIGYWVHTKVSWLPLPDVQEWIMDVPNTAGQRAILIGSALGVISTSLRMLLGYEQTYLGSE